MARQCDIIPFDWSGHIRLLPSTSNSLLALRDRVDFRSWPLADTTWVHRCPLLRSLLGLKRTSFSQRKMSAFGPKRTIEKTHLMSLSGVKRT
jgi:hypothetical protein